MRAIVASQATIGAAVAFVFGATTLSPSFLRRQDIRLRAADLESLPENRFQSRCASLVTTATRGSSTGPSCSWCVWASVGALGHPIVLLPANTFEFLLDRVVTLSGSAEDAGRMRKDQCVAFRLH